MKFCLNCNSEYGDERDVCPKDGAQLAQKSQDPLLGTVVQNKYKVEALLGKGAMGAVYKVTEQSGGDQYALKVLHSFLGDDNESVIRFHREAKATSKLKNPHVVSVHDFGVMPHGQPYLVMELLQGVSLEKVLENKSYMPLADTLPIVKQVCDALEQAHDKGIIHRDIKPDNIVLETRDGRSDYVKVVDFGIAKMAQSPDETPIKLTRTGMICGSPAYISPESIQGQTVDVRGDVYSLGVVIFEMITGTVPFTAQDLVKLLFMHVTETPPTLAEVRPDLIYPASIERVVAKALAKDPDQRQQTMRQLWDELEEAARGVEITAAPQAQASVKAQAPAPAAPPAPAAKPIETYRPPPESARSGAFPAAQAEPPALPPTRRRSGAFDAVPDQALSGSSAAIRAAGSRRDSGEIRSYEQMPVAFRASGSQAAGPSGMPMALKTWIMCLVVIAAVVLVVMHPWAQKAKDPQTLLNDGRAEEAMLALSDKKRQGKLSDKDNETLGKVLIVLAKKKAQQGLYASAISLLQQVPPKCSKSGEARTLLRQYRRKQGR